MTEPALSRIEAAVRAGSSATPGRYHTEPATIEREVEVAVGTRFVIQGATFVVTAVNSAKRRFTAQPVEGTVWSNSHACAAQNTVAKKGGACSGP